MALQDLVTIHVDDNLRNTKRIAETFKSFAGEKFTPRGSTGLAVRRVEYSPEEAIDVASDSVDSLISEGWATDQIALLTTKTRHPIHQGFFESDTLTSIGANSMPTRASSTGRSWVSRALNDPWSSCGLTGSATRTNLPSGCMWGCHGRGRCSWLLATRSNCVKAVETSWISRCCGRSPETQTKLLRQVFNEPSHQAQRLPAVIHFDEKHFGMWLLVQHPDLYYSGSHSGSEIFFKDVNIAPEKALLAVIQFPSEMDCGPTT
ncbi:hypothetical protein ACX80D_16585 [Arthrobacter sp. Sr24]